MSIDTVSTSTQLLADHGDGPGWWPIFPLLWFLFFVGFAFFVIRMGVRRRASCLEDRRQEPRRAGETRLADRFAAGDIDEHEYRRRLAVLREPPAEEELR